MKLRKIKRKIIAIALIIAITGTTQGTSTLSNTVYANNVETKTDVIASEAEEQKEV